jgi:hypothetical protein
MCQKLTVTKIMFVLLITLFSDYTYATERKFTDDEIGLLNKTNRIRVILTTSYLEKVNTFTSLDIEEIIKIKLKSLGFTPVSEQDRDYDATMFVDYEESLGAKYIPGGRGINIKCSIRVDHRVLGTIFEKIIRASSSSEVKMRIEPPFHNSFRQSAVYNFLKERDFDNLQNDLCIKIRKNGSCSE